MRHQMGDERLDNSTTDRHRALAAEIRRFDATMARLADLGIDLHRPPRELLADLRARKDEMRRQHEELEATQREVDRRLLPELLDLYINGGDQDREALRALLAECRTFRWGFGWGLASRIATADDARNALAVFSMKDGDRDWRDEILALDHLCAAIEKAGLPVAALLTEAAGWSSDVPRFGPLNIRSTHDHLLDRAQRFGS